MYLLKAVVRIGTTGTRLDEQMVLLRFCYCCHRWGELLFKESPVWQVLSAGAWDEESSRDVRSPPVSIQEPMTTDVDEPSGSVTSRQGKARKRKGCHKPSVQIFKPPLMFHCSLGGFTEGGFLKGSSFCVASLPWCTAHGTVPVAPSQHIQRDPAGCCSSQGRLTLSLLLLNPHPVVLSTLPRGLDATPWICPDTDT